MHVNDLLKLAVERGASDLHLKAGSYPMMRIRGGLTPVSQDRRLDHEDMVAITSAVLPTALREKFKDSHEVDLAYSVPGLGRFRCNAFQQRGTIGMTLRVIPFRVPTIPELTLPPVLKKITQEERGLILVTGTTGSGKSTTLAAMIDDINSSRTENVMTIEDPIEYLHRDKRSIVCQREVGIDTKSFSKALRSALRLVRPGMAMAVVGVWAFFSAVVLAYETTSMVWAFSGLVLGLAALDDSRSDARGGAARHGAAANPRASGAVHPEVHVGQRSQDGRRARR